MPRADKRQRKKENARMAREAREAAARRRKRMRTARNVGIIAVLFVGTIVIFNIVSGGSSKKSSPTSTTVSTPTTAAVKLSAPDLKLDPGKTYTAAIKTNFGNIVLALDTKNDPVGAGHFIKLARSGYYNGSRWHRIVADFVIQGGAPKGDISKSYPNPVVAERPTDHYPVGSVAAAKTQNDPPGTFADQFFIVDGQQQGASLPNDYARFGSVKSGMDVVNKIGKLPVDANGAPTQPATIDSITITES